MRKSILSVIVCLFMLTCVGCEKNNYEKDSKCFILDAAHSVHI